MAGLEAFLRDRQHDPQARRLAYELVLEHDNTAAVRLLPGMLDDPSAALRHDAVERVLNQAEALTKAGKKTEALPLWRQAFTAAREKGQIDKAVRSLRELGERVDLPVHLGLILNWKLIGPFANVKQQGRETIYPPEQGLDATASYDGKTARVRWLDYVSKDANGHVDLTAAIGKHTEAIGYAWTDFVSRDERDAEIRLGCYTPFKLWVNGKLVLTRGESYTGVFLDHSRAKIHLKKGTNTILLKIIQDELPQGIPYLWQFLLRVCDDSGVAILSTARPPPPPPEKKP
jgi:hypothetical protein